MYRFLEIFKDVLLIIKKDGACKIENLNAS